MMSSNGKPEEMGNFFNARVDGYDEHMLDAGLKEYYVILSEPIEEKSQMTKILDLGCGTGLEIKGIFDKAPNAQITGIDLSEKMLGLLEKKYSQYSEQLDLIQGSYLTLPFGEAKYDYVTSSQTMHHFLPREKLELYHKIRKALKSGGKYIEGDYVVSEEKEKRLLKRYKEKLEEIEGPKELYHIDIPFSIKTQKKLMLDAGFKEVEIIFDEDEAVIFVATT